MEAHRHKCTKRDIIIIFMLMKQHTEFVLVSRSTGFQVALIEPRPRRHAAASAPLDPPSRVWHQPHIRSLSSRLSTDTLNYLDSHCSGEKIADATANWFTFATTHKSVRQKYPCLFLTAPFWCSQNFIEKVIGYLILKNWNPINKKWYRCPSVKGV